MEWLDKSDLKSRFYVAESSTEIYGAVFLAFINELVEFVISTIIGDGSVKYDKLFIEVNCDTGRIIISPSTEEGRASGKLNGCAVRLPRLQDFWYDLDESGVSGEVFTEGVRNEIIRIGEQFGNQVENHIEALLSRSSKQSIELIVFGSEPDKVLYRKELTGS